MKLETLNLNEICRTCKCVSSQMQSLFERYKNLHQGSRFDEMLMACASVQVMCGDGLPEQICQICLEQLKNAFLFKQQCEKIDAILREYAKSVKVNEIKQELQNSDFMESLNTLNNLLDEQSTSKSSQDVETSSVTAGNETDYIQFLDNNQMLLTCRECAKIFTTLEGLRCHKLIHSSQNLYNLEDRYHQIHQDAETIHNCFESHVEMAESMDDERLNEVADIGRNHGVSNDRNGLIRGGSDKDNEMDSSLDKTVENLVNEKMGGNKEVKVEELMEDSFPEEEDHLPVAGEDSNSIDSDYLSRKADLPKMKPGRGRLRKIPDASAKPPAVISGRETPPTKGMEKKAVENNKFLCPFCQEAFNTLNSLDRHARMKHDGLKAHKCNVCNKEFGRASHLNQHLKLHERSYDFECDRCQEVFNRDDQLSKHKASKHGVVGKKTHPLLVCSSPNGKEEHQSKLPDSQLTEHIKSDRKRPKKYSCTECDQKFIRNDYLVVHMRRHRGEKPFKCKYCGKGFARTTDLTVHERCHTGEKTHLCTICGKGFGRAYNLTVHMRTHTGEKPYQCTYCDAAFAQSNDLKTHIRRHTGERFQCDLCSDRFIMGYLLTQHKRLVHGLNIVTNRLQPLQKQDNPDGPPAVTVPLLESVEPENDISDD